ncbi:Agamous-like MADS-box protein AGL61 [Linum perenne]
MAEPENANDRPINFSTRRSAIYKNAGDLVTSCGSEVGFLFFSKCGSPFSYGYPSIEAVANRFLDKPAAAIGNCRTCDDIAIMELNHRRDDLIEESEALKLREAVLRRRMEAAKGKKKKSDWWDVPVEDLSLEQLRIAESEIVKISKVLDGCGNINRPSFGVGSSARESRRLNLGRGNSCGGCSGGAGN